MAAVVDRFADLRRVQEGGGSHIEPPLDETWDDLTKLHWKAATTEVDTGIRVRVSAGGHQVKRRGRWVDVPGTYSIQVGGTSVGSYDYSRVWTFLNGVSTGASEKARADA